MVELYMKKIMGGADLQQLLRSAPPPRDGEGRKAGIHLVDGVLGFEIGLKISPRQVGWFSTPRFQCTFLILHLIEENSSRTHRTPLHLLSIIPTVIFFRTSQVISRGFTYILYSHHKHATLPKCFQYPIMDPLQVVLCAALRIGVDGSPKIF